MGFVVGPAVGTDEGVWDGTPLVEGLAVGRLDGTVVGLPGAPVGDRVGIADGIEVGFTVGPAVGSDNGVWLNSDVGDRVGLALGFG